MNSTLHEMQGTVSTPCYGRERKSMLTKRAWMCVILYLHLSWQKELRQLTQCPGLITAVPEEATTPPGYLSCSRQSFPTHFSLNKWALLKKAASKSLLTQLDSWKQLGLGCLWPGWVARRQGRAGNLFSWHCRSWKKDVCSHSDLPRVRLWRKQACNCCS